MLLFFFSYVLRSKRKGKACFYRLCEERFGRKKKKNKALQWLRGNRNCTHFFFLFSVML